jgi:hypothetical protein
LEFPSRGLCQLHFPDGTDLLDLLDEAGIHWCRSEPQTQLNGSPSGIERKAAMLVINAKVADDRIFGNHRGRASVSKRLEGVISSEVVIYSL